MQFELTEALLDDILFSMEDQEGEFYIDCQEEVVINGEELADINNDRDDRFIDLPEWDSSNGFRLMERFAAAFRNPIIRTELCSALNQGRGVFRAFKNALSHHPEAEKYWFSFKEREMKREIVRWYNALREEWGLQKIGMEPEETTDLVLEDFRFCDLEKPESGDNTFSLIAESGNGDLAGTISAERTGNALFIRVLEVKPEFRGLGIGKTLLTRLLAKVKNSAMPGQQVQEVYLDLPVEAEGFSRVLAREGFMPSVTRYCLLIK